MFHSVEIENVDLTGGIPEQEPARQYYFIAALRQLVQEQAERLGHPLRVFNLTVGCQMNAKDSEKLLGILEIA